MRLKQKEINEILLYYQKGWNISDISKKFNKRYDNIRTLIKKRLILRDRADRKVPISEYNNIIYEYTILKNNTSIIADKYKVTRKCIEKILLKNNIEKINKKQLKHNLNPTNKKYLVNEKYFDVIDTEDKAYFLGLLYADGCNTRKGFSIALQECDKYILELFLKYMKSNHVLFFRKKRELTHQNYYGFSINNKYLEKSLSNLGCVPKKSLIINFPTEKQVPSFLIRHFLRGMWDGDGTIGFYDSRRRPNNKQCSARLISSNILCIELQSYIKKYLDISCSLSLRGKNKTCTALSVGGNKQVLRFLNWLYNDASIYLKRKYDKYLEIKIYLQNKQK